MPQIHFQRINFPKFIHPEIIAKRVGDVTAVKRNVLDPSPSAPPRIPSIEMVEQLIVQFYERHQYFPLHLLFPIVYIDGDMTATSAAATKTAVIVYKRRNESHAGTKGHYALKEIFQFTSPLAFVEVKTQLTYQPKPNGGAPVPTLVLESVQGTRFQTSLDRLCQDDAVTFTQTLTEVEAPAVTPWLDRFNDLLSQPWEFEDLTQARTILAARWIQQRLLRCYRLAHRVGNDAPPVALQQLEVVYTLVTLKKRHEDPKWQPQLESMLDVLEGLFYD